MHIIGVSGGQGLSIGECIFASLGFRISSWSVVGEEQVSKATHTSHFPLPFTHKHTLTHKFTHFLIPPFFPGLPQFFLVGIHTKPSKAFSEINALVDVYDEAVHHYGTENGIILGDFNADCSYLSQRRYNMLQLVTDSRFTWLLDTDVDTTTKNSNCAYDRCVCVCVWEGGRWVYVWLGGEESRVERVEELWGSGQKTF